MTVLERERTEGRIEGRTECRIEGITKGRTEERANFIREMLAMGISEEKVRQIVKNVEMADSEMTSAQN